MRGGLSLEHLITLATVYALIWATGASFLLLSSRRDHLRRAAFQAAGSWLALAWVVWFSAQALAGHNSVIQLFASLRSASPQHWCAAGLGGALGVWASLWSNADLPRRLARVTGHLCLFGSFLLLGVLALEKQIALRWTHSGAASIALNPSGSAAPPGFTLDIFHECKQPPVQLAVGPSGKLYYCHMAGAGVSRVDSDPRTGRTRETQVAWNLDRIHGLAFYQADLYVSRSGNHLKAKFGKMKNANTGAVTLLRDLDGDGVFDYFHDVVEDLPGSQLPDEVHQNNGIAFSRDGSMYITEGSNGNKMAPVHEYEGTVLKSRPDGSGLRVFARGMRNPFDCAVGPDEELFCTDNDVSFGQSDELNHVVDGGHYGHPYVESTGPRTGEHPAGATAPLWVIARTSLQGLVYARSEKLPAEYRNCLYVVGHPNGELFRVKLRRQGRTYQAEATPFGKVPQALDITADDDGVFYISSYHMKRIYRLRRNGP